MLEMHTFKITFASHVFEAQLLITAMREIARSNERVIAQSRETIRQTHAMLTGGEDG